MSKVFKHFCVLFIVSVLLSSTGWGIGSSPLPLQKAYKTLFNNKGKNCFIFGRFQMVHTLDRTLMDPSLYSRTFESITNDCGFKVTMELINQDNNKTYRYEIKPVTGSSTSYYFKSLLTKNSEDTYLLLEVPAGNYEFTTITCQLNIRKIGYNDYVNQMFNLPISKLLKKTVTINTHANQIVYIGDYDVSLTTNIVLSGVERLYPFSLVKIDLYDYFETAKTALINGSDDKTRAKINEYEIVSAIQK